MTEPIALLHHCHATNVPYTLVGKDGQTSTDVREAAAVQFPNPANSAEPIRFDVNAQSGFKDFDLRALLFFYQSRDISFPDYLKLVSSDKRSFNFIDRKELWDYLEGDISALAKNAKDNAVGASAKRPLQEQSEAPAGASKRPRLALKPEDVEFARRAKLRERTITDNTSILSLPANSTKNFAHILELSRKRMAEQSRKPPSSQTNSGSSQTRTQSGHSAQRTDGHKDTRQSSQARPASQSRSGRQGGSDARIPIIIVPAAPTAKLTLWNVKQFLCGNNYIRTEQFVEQGQPKPPRIVLERQLKPNHPGGPNFPRVYHVVDSADNIKPEDWSRVVAAFVTGQGWQFNRWKYKDPVQLFSKLKGFCLKFIDEPAPGDVEKWAVTKLDLHRNRRHNDYQAINKFWDQVDNFIMREKRRQFLE